MIRGMNSFGSPVKLSSSEKKRGFLEEVGVEAVPDVKFAISFHLHFRDFFDSMVEREWPPEITILVVCQMFEWKRLIFSPIVVANVRYLDSGLGYD